ncbi:phage tail tape measure protein [Streptococcus agalactiae]|uniref:phage tail tape measure protein n=1 Tax=Streptococcus agalactiae TaxID=1311 RepID=UPI00064068D8|nr:phage tail tape measure protein [Streptococcus agalactiae]KLL30401.1 TMP repeat protein [Streptococcus agalactiae]KLL31481.1 TMP repeat protein [Streptococcus agalactiae]KLL95050.1 TMP repeat protein [Streptococcus agalactiae]MBY5050801.1 phage tail tape measure protein [Streptococcus agalactiae]QHO93040.1 phage tail tape measure protein [Streptococcus agalactiae]
MAGNIKGITIEIGGDTQPLQNALKGVNKQASEATKELRQIDKALKFDTGNVTLLTQKQEVLAKQVETTKEKLATLRQAQAQVEAQFKAGNIGADQYRAFQREVESTQTVLKGYESKLESVNKALSDNGTQVESNRSKLNRLQNEQAQLVSESEKLNSSFKLQESALATTASEADKLALAQQKVASHSEILEKQIHNLEQQLSLTKSEYGENSVEANKLEKTLNETKTSYNNLQNEMEGLASSSASSKASLEETNSLLKADLLMEFGDQLGELSQKLIDFGQQSLDAFLEVDEGMDIIVTKTGATGSALEEMTDIAKTLATELPTDFNTAGSAVGELNTQFGLTGDALKSASTQLIQFSEINGSDVTSSAISAKQAIEAYGLEATDLSSVLDTVTYTSQATGVGVQELMDKAVAGAPQIKALGLSFDEGVTLMGQFEKAGVDSSAALSSLSKAAVKYAGDGLTLQEGLAGTIGQIKASTSETEALSLASEIFGSKAAPRMVDAIKRGALSFEDLAGTADKAAGIVTRTYEGTLDPIDKFTTAQNTAKLAMAEIGDAIAATLAPILEILASLLQAVATWFSGLSEPVKQFIVIVGSLVAALGLVLPIFIALQAAAMAMGTTIMGMITAAAPIVGIILGVIAVVALLVVGIQQLWQHHEGFRTAVTEIWNAIYAFLSVIIQQISSFVMSIWGTLTTWWTENQQLILKAANTVWTAISTVIQTIMTILGPYLQASWENIKLIITTAWDIIKVVVETAINVLLGIIKAVMQIITGDWSGTWETIKQVVSTVWEAIKSLISIVLNAIAQFISNSWNGIKSTISSILSSISSTVSSIWNGMKATISGVLSGISSAVSSVWNGVKSTITNAINGAKNAVSSAINAIKNLFNFKIKWPHIPLPHFSVSGSANPLDWLKGGLPKISIQWYAKGGILTKPTAFGMTGNSLMVGGEAGREAVLPLNNQTLGSIGRSIAATMPNKGTTITVNITDVVIREEADMKKLADYVAGQLADEMTRQALLRGGTV